MSDRMKLAHIKALEKKLAEAEKEIAEAKDTASYFKREAVRLYAEKKEGHHD